MMCLSMLQEVAAVILNVIYLIHCFSFEKEQFLVLIAAILNFISAFFCTISSIMFGVQVESDRQWLPQPDSNFLSWAYGFCILGALLALFSGMCALTDYFRLRVEKERDGVDRGYPGAVVYAPREYSRPPNYRY
nr:hypothetical protein BaRGS_025999 [Batillaria attramentaria]